MSKKTFHFNITNESHSGLLRDPDKRCVIKHTQIKDIAPNDLDQ